MGLKERLQKEWQATKADLTLKFNQGLRELQEATVAFPGQTPVSVGPYGQQGHPTPNDVNDLKQGKENGKVSDLDSWRGQAEKQTSLRERLAEETGRNAVAAKEPDMEKISEVKVSEPHVSEPPQREMEIE